MPSSKPAAIPLSKPSHAFAIDLTQECPSCRKPVSAFPLHTFSRQPSLPFAENNSVPELPPEEATVFAALGDQESGVDRLIDATGLPSQIVTATLMKLEMRRLVRALPGFRYVKR